MKLTITFNGALVRYTGNEKSEIEIADNACFEDLLFEIGRRYGDKMPAANAPKAPWVQVCESPIIMV